MSDQASCTYSPLSLCNQAIYPGDDKLLVMEKEILEVKYHILDDPFYTNKNKEGKVRLRYFRKDFVVSILSLHKTTKIFVSSQIRFFFLFIFTLNIIHTLSGWKRDRTKLIILGVTVNMKIFKVWPYHDVMMSRVREK